MKYALVIGSQIEGLRGVAADTRAMQGMLAQRGFAVELRTGDDATRAGILAGYEALIARCQAGDAAVVYYSGHGYHAVVPDEDAAWQCIAPTDLRDGDAGDYRGITAWELSLLQERLTERTANVTVILDCCHSSQMSRDAAARDAIPRALPHPLAVGFAEHLAALRAAYGPIALDPVGNPHAVRVVACGQAESAFEYRTPSGEVRGAFTEALLAILAEIGDAEVSWAAIADALRARVLRRFAHQRPEIEGPVRRRLFALTEDEDGQVATVRRVDDQLALPGGALTGVRVGDRYGLMPVGATRFAVARAIAEVEVVGVEALTARLQVRAWHHGHTAIPVDAAAIPIARSAVRRAVAVEAAAAERQVIAQAIGATSTLRVASAGEGAIATLRLAGDRVTVEDAAGPRFAPAGFPDQLDDVIEDLDNLAVAQALRELEGEHGVRRDEVAIELGVIDGGKKLPLVGPHAALGLRDRFYLQVCNRGARRLFAHVVNLGLQGTVTLLTGTIAPSGIALDAGDPPFVLGRRADGSLPGIGIVWPDGLPRTGAPRRDEYLVIVTSSPMSLAILERRVHQAPATRGERSPLQALLGQLRDGQLRDAALDEATDGFLVQRLSYLLYPRAAALGGPRFELDESPGGQGAARDPAAWVTPDAAARLASAPVPIALRLVELAVDPDRAPFAGELRLDALVCTCGGGDRPGLTTWTRRIARAGGLATALDDAPLHVGPVSRFVDVALFVSPDCAGSLDLGALLAEQAARPELADALAALRGAPGADTPWIAAVGASAVLARAARDVLRATMGQTLGLHRTAFLDVEGFGLGRHPAQGRYRARGLTYAIAIEPAGATPP